MSWLLLLIVPVLCHACPTCKDTNRPECWDVQCTETGAHVTTWEGALTGSSDGEWTLLRASCLNGGKCWDNPAAWGQGCVAATGSMQSDGKLHFDVSFDAESKVSIGKNRLAFEQKFVVCNSVHSSPSNQIITQLQFNLETQCCYDVDHQGSGFLSLIPPVELVTEECDDEAQFSLTEQKNPDPSAGSIPYDFGERLFFQVNQHKPRHPGTQLHVEKCWALRSEGSAQRVDLTWTDSTGVATANANLQKLNGAQDPSYSSDHFEYNFEFDAFVFSEDYAQYLLDQGGLFSLWIYCDVKAVPRPGYLAAENRLAISLSDLPEEEIKFGPILVKM